MTRRGRQPEAEQFDLFTGGGTVEPAAAPADAPLCPETLSDEDVLGRIPNARIADVRVLCRFAVERGLGDRAVPALEALWRRFRGFGHDRPLPEQTAVIETLAKLETAGARQLLAEIATAHDLPPPLLPAALSAALSASLRLPVHVLRSLLAHADPRIRELAARLSGFGQPDIGALAACLGDTQPAVQRAAAIVLGQFGHAAAKAILLSELRRAPTGDIVEALSAIADDDIIVHLGRCAAAHPALAGRIAAELEGMETALSLKVARRIRDELAEAGRS
ncbi:MAG: HEAT repeat domain-containing protein [Rhodospirillaceae bacterium]|nr:HEAT repeat domain-containing protein [Rhodospirillaceae bacterium]MYF86621.1 HEAT repeat domain-containing protein [Rhodospirillaceae bacterium]MYH36490.1 HEAT repeat domain-containing protein [Rhodospirillaceae bacterium]MYK14705.1 HEAT repeat domain-containing protein [Rhodospirillaceae bacterium]MYK57250.1 HEAT repeat domain-containing protein [Rhodospirillaceae bacterium]